MTVTDGVALFVALALVTIGFVAVRMTIRQDADDEDESP